jgi:hypothetical protein
VKKIMKKEEKQKILPNVIASEAKERKKIR